MSKHGGVVLIACLALGCGDEGLPNGTKDGTMLSPYLAIGDTLASDEVDHLAELGALVVTAAEPRQGQPGVDAIVLGASRIGTQDIATARLAFKKMSGGMIEYLRAHVDEQEGAMVVHCPMTFDGEGAAWVQTRGKVMNPYEGAMMLHCGDEVAWDDPRAGS